MVKDTIKNYDSIKNKLQQNWDDTQYLIALHNLALKQIKELNDKVDRLWASINSINEDNI